jgi:hypothetical protein
MSWTIRATEDVEVAVMEWTAAHPEYFVIARDESGIWYDDAMHSTHLLRWPDLMKWAEENIPKEKG